MSRLNVSSLQAKNNTTKVISLEEGTKLYYPETVIQTITVRSDARSVYSSPATGNGTTITDLNVSITPKFDSSLIIITWMINGEVHHNNVFTIHQDGLLITTDNYQGYNNNAGNSRWSGVASGYYDRDESSTPSNWVIQYAVPATNTTTRTYAPAIKGSTGTAYNFAFNRTLSGSTSDSHESMISTAIAMEIMQ